jgi:hypothetical protein
MLHNEKEDQLLNTCERFIIFYYYYYVSIVLCWVLDSFSNSWVGRISCSRDQPVARPLLHTGLHKHRRNTYRQASMPQVGFEPTTPMFERAKRVHSLDRVASVLSCERFYTYNISKEDYKWMIPPLKSIMFDLVIKRTHHIKTRRNKPLKHTPATYQT